MNIFAPSTPAAVKSWQRAQSQHPVGDSPDLQRILRLARRPPPDKITSEALIEIETEKYRRKNAPPCKCAAILKARGQKPRKCITRLRRSQAWILYELAQVGGLLGQVGVGHGKSLADLLAPLAMGLKHGEVAVLLCPPGNVEEIISDYELAGAHFEMPSITCFGRIDYTVARPGMPSLYVVPYSMISRPEFTHWMDKVAPKAIIADEVDKLRHLDTATVGRIARCMQARPETKFAGWTGSLSDKGLLDFYHLLIWALRYNSPLPLNKEVVQDWGRALNPSEDPASPGALLSLCAPGENVGAGFQRRLAETMGFVITTEGAIDAPMVVTRKEAPPIPEEIERALYNLRADMVRPDGEQFADPLRVAECAKQLACGFFYKWIYPRDEPKELIEEWFEARKEWFAQLRWFVQERRPGLDSEKLGTDAARRAWGELEGDGPQWKATKWPRWQRVKDLVQPDTKAVRVHDFLARDAALWALQNRGIVWYAHKEFGLWVAELSGLPLHEGGPGARERILAETGERSIVASMDSHGRGRDGLQFAFRDQLITSPPASGGKWEQLLGRLHRPGQEADIVRASFYAHTIELDRSYRTALLCADYTSDRIGTAQKLRQGEF